MARVRKYVVLLLALCPCISLLCRVSGPGTAQRNPDEPPAAPSLNDPSFVIQNLRQWYLIPNGLTSSYASLHFSVHTGVQCAAVRAFIDGEAAGVFDVSDGTCSLCIEIDGLPAGEHTLLLSAGDADTGFGSFSFIRTHPLYVVVSSDWDHAMIPAGDIVRQDTLHANHPALRITHFVGPYLFTDPELADSSRQWQTAWLKHARDELHDEIGVHIHPYCHFTACAGVACVVDTPWDGSEADSTGYGIGCNRYTEEQFSRLLRAADSLFALHGFARPTSFRAGGWSASASTLRALAQSGFTVDASGANTSRIEELAVLPVLFEYLNATWPHISDTSQPYYPGPTAPSVTTAPVSPCLEVPDNGVLADFITAAEMLEIFRDLFTGRHLTSPKQLSVGYHPETLAGQNLSRLDEALDTIDTYRAAGDRGPVVYATMSELPLVWPHH